MTNVVSLHAPGFDGSDGVEAMAKICRTYMQDAVIEAQGIAQRYATLYAGFIPGTDAFDYLDTIRYPLQQLRSDAAHFCHKLRGQARQLDIPDAITDKVVESAQPVMEDLVQRINTDLGRRRPYTPPTYVAPGADNDLGGGGGGGFMQLIVWIALLCFAAFVVLAAFSGTTPPASQASSTSSGSGYSLPGVAPYAWLGMHNGKLSKGFGLRLKGSRGHHH